MLVAERNAARLLTRHAHHFVRPRSTLHALPHAVNQLALLADDAVTATAAAAASTGGGGPVGLLADIFEGALKVRRFGACSTHDTSPYFRRGLHSRVVVQGHHHQHSACACSCWTRRSRMRACRTLTASPSSC
jgi:hypothetical protein